MNLNLVIPGNRIGDAWQYSDDGLVHCFYLHTAACNDLTGRNGGKVDLFAERGKVSFRDTLIHIIRQEENA